MFFKETSICTWIRDTNAVENVSKKNIQLMSLHDPNIILKLD